MKPQSLAICIVYSPQARTTVQHNALLPAGSTVQDAIATLDLSQAQIHQLFTDSSGAICCGIWGKKAPLDTPLQDGDRLELYRDLVVDPKTARRLRFAKQGSRGAGLFAGRGSKK